MDVLVVAAFHPELEPLRALLGDGLTGRIGSKEVAARVVGIGLPQASVGAALRIPEVRPSAVVMVGTCGAYPGGSLHIGDVVVARRILLVEPAVLDGLAATPEPMPLATEGDPGIRAALCRAGAVAADVATTLGVTVDDALAARIGQVSGAHAEHMEAYGVALASAHHGVPFAAVLGVANEVGSRARGEWRANHREAARAAVSVVTAWLVGSLP
jgi:futalosine hydrolase